MGRGGPSHPRQRGAQGPRPRGPCGRAARGRDPAHGGGQAPGRRPGHPGRGELREVVFLPLSASGRGRGEGSPPMRILAVTNEYPSPFEPQRATFNRQQFLGLAREHEISVIAPIAWTDELAARRAGKGPLPTGRRATLDGIPAEYPPYLS